MKNIKIIISILFLIVVASSCTKIEGIDQDLSFLTTAVSANLDKSFDISNDNSGFVRITPVSDGVASSTVYFGHGTGNDAKTNVSAGGNATHIYPEGTYTVTIVSRTVAGDSTVMTYPLAVTYRAPENLKVTIESNMVVSADALYAKSFEVSYGDTTGKVYPLALGAKLPAHTYPAGGPYDLKVVALSGGAATTTVVRTMFGFPITFESPTMNYSFVTTSTGQTFEKIINPFATGLNTSANIGKFIRGSDGTSSTTSLLDIPLNFAAGKIIKMLVYNPSATLINKKMYVELQNAVGGTPANGIAVKSAKITTSGAWEELTFDFSTFTTAQIPANTKFGQIVISYALGIPAGGIIYIDNIRLTN